MTRNTPVLAPLTGSAPTCRSPAVTLFRPHPPSRCRAAAARSTSRPRCRGHAASSGGDWQRPALGTLHVHPASGAVANPMRLCGRVGRKNMGLGGHGHLRPRRAGIRDSQPSRTTHDRMRFACALDHRSRTYQPVTSTTAHGRLALAAVTQKHLNAKLDL